MEMKFDTEREVLENTKTELLARVEAINHALEALGGSSTNGTPSKAKKVETGVTVGRKPMSPKAKKAARERMLAYWANKRREAGRTKTR